MGSKTAMKNKWLQTVKGIFTKKVVYSDQDFPTTGFIYLLRLVRAFLLTRLFSCVSATFSGGECY